MKKTLEAVIFDLDGVIADTFELSYITNKKIATQLSISLSKEDNNRFRGIGRTAIINDLVQKSGKYFTEEEKMVLAEQKNKHYQQLIELIDKTAILPGIEEFILSLKEKNIRIALASSSTNGKTVLTKIGLLPYFDYIVNPSTLSKGKPDSEIFLKAAKELEISPENCVAIEDGDAGMKAIKSTKMFSIGVGNVKGMENADWHVLNTSEITLEQLLIRFEG